MRTLYIVSTMSKTTTMTATSEDAGSSFFGLLYSIDYVKTNVSFWDFVQYGCKYNGIIHYSQLFHKKLFKIYSTTSIHIHFSNQIFLFTNFIHTFVKVTSNWYFMKPKRIILIRHGESEANVNLHLFASIPTTQSNWQKKEGNKR